MEKKMMAWKTKGMNRDLSVSAFNPEFAFENMNLRLATNEGNTMLSWVNERGTKIVTPVINKEGSNMWPYSNTVSTVNIIEGTPIGTAVIGKYLVLFTTKGDGASKVDYIYRLQLNSNEFIFSGIILYKGNLEFDVLHPIETLVSYESEAIQKVYWTDGENQPRMINVVKKLTPETMYNDTSFDFVQDLELEEEVYVRKLFNSSGTFAPGVIQYAMTYYNKNGQETNVFYTTPLCYISPKDRGAAPDERVDNAFKVTIKNPDTKFDYLRIYSIQRTSINDTPFCKRVQDIELKKDDTEVSYTDRGTSGNSIDPTELLYKGGENVVVQTMEQKDGTLFLGGITLKREMVELDEKKAQDTANISISSTSDTTRAITPTAIMLGDYKYGSQLTAYDDTGNNVPCGYFKKGENYRWGVQFQHKSGKWSNPIWLDKDSTLVKANVSENSSGVLELPVMKGTVKKDYIINTLLANDYKKVRAVVVFPEINDRNILCQGVVNPTLYTNNHRGYSEGSSTDLGLKDLYAQSSWFFRADYKGTGINTNNGSVSPYDGVTGSILQYTQALMGKHEDIPDPYDGYNPVYIKQVEIQGNFDPKNQFRIDKETLTYHSPDIEFDTQLSVLEFNGFGSKQVGYAKFARTFSDVNIQTESPTIGSGADGFVKDFVISNSTTAGIVSGLLYEDFVVDDTVGGEFEKYHAMQETSRGRWLVYPWNGNGSLNNDIERPADKGTASAKLKKKILSHLRISNTVWKNGSILDFYTQPVLFSSNEVSIVKLTANNFSGNYQGNIDTILNPDTGDGMYFAFNSRNIGEGDVSTPYNSDVNWKTYNLEEDSEEAPGLYLWNADGDSEWDRQATDVGDNYLGVVRRKSMVRMKYKSTPHFVFRYTNDTAGHVDWYSSNDYDRIPIIEITKNHSTDTLFGGNTPDALKENVWVPCGRPVKLEQKDAQGNQIDVDFYWEYGDTYYQRWDCLKTYPFTPEDVNQVVEIGSFMLETHVNIDGRYDRNRGQQSNLYMTPQNFNLMNMVYSQKDNFFTYRIMDKEDYEGKEYPNRITWTLTKESGADVDKWTQITLASMLELDGDKGAVRKLVRLNDALLAFQDKGISQVMYNENVQISSTEGVPIEIANSGKVQGKRYISSTIGCSNKWSMVTTPMGIYFMDSNDKGIYLFNGQLENLSLKGGMNSWCKGEDGIPAFKGGWNPDIFEDFVAYYDKLNQDVLFISGEKALAYSEKFGAFTSFYNYENSPYLCTIEDTPVWLRKDMSNGQTLMYLHQKGEYCEFFEEPKPYWMTLVGNPEPLVDKVFTNLEFRACVEGDGVSSGDKKPFGFYLPFDGVEVWDEYQHGYTKLENKNGHGGMMHGGDSSALKRKFRIWRCDMPRDNAEVDAETEALMGITRAKRRPLDRMRNPWVYLKLMKKEEENMHKVEVHDMVMTYFS